MENNTKIDDGIRLLNEIHEKIKSNIISMTEVKVNNLNAVIIVWQNRINGSGKEFTIKFNINGQDFTAEGSYNGLDIIANNNSGKSEQQMIHELVYKAIMDTLAKLIYHEVHIIQK